MIIIIFFRRSRIKICLFSTFYNVYRKRNKYAHYQKYLYIKRLRKILHIEIDTDDAVIIIG